MIFDNDFEDDEESIEISEEFSSRHTANGAHSLVFDSIFKGKKEAPLTEFDNIEKYKEKNIMDVESSDTERSYKDKILSERIYELALSNNKINILTNTKRPNKSDFNNFFHYLSIALKDEGFSHCEIFCEFCNYYTKKDDKKNEGYMKLLTSVFTNTLDKKYRDVIVKELQDHVGKKNGHKKIHMGDEIQFIHDGQYISGNVVEIDYEYSFYMVDSYGMKYEIGLTYAIVEFDNNYKYNLNKLVNIEFI